MSKKTVVEVDDRWFWVYDVCRSILLAEIVRAADAGQGDEPKLSAEKLHDLRVLAVVGDFAFMIDKDWSPAERMVLADLVRTAIDRLGEREEISEAEGRRWLILDDQAITWRRGDEPTAPVIEFGQALLQLLQGTHEPDPDGNRQWFYGFPGGRKAL